MPARGGPSISSATATGRNYKLCACSAKFPAQHTAVWLFLFLMAAPVAVKTVSDTSQEGAGWLPGSYPNPTRDWQLCGHEPVGKLELLCDPDQILTDRQADEVILSIKQVVLLTQP